MILQLAIAAALVVGAAVAAKVLRSRRVAEAPTQPQQWSVPAQLDLADFASRGDEPWSVVIFTSATCDVCQSMKSKADVLRSANVAVIECEYVASRELHRKYGVDAVPMVVIADEHGVVQRSFVGPASATDLWAAVAHLRDPDTTPDPGHGCS